MTIHDLKYIKAAYGFENLGTCAFSSKVGRARKSFLDASNYVYSTKTKTSWIAIYIPRSSRGYRKEIEILPDISKFEGFIAAFQELIHEGGLNYKDWGIDERWDMGIPSKRIFAFKEPKIPITDIFSDGDLKDFYAAATASGAHKLNEVQEKTILKRFSMSDLIEIKKEKKYLDLHPLLKEK